MAERSKAVDSSDSLTRFTWLMIMLVSSHYSTLVRGVGSNPTLVNFFFSLSPCPIQTNQQKTRQQTSIGIYVYLYIYFCFTQFAICPRSVNVLINCSDKK